MCAFRLGRTLGHATMFALVITGALLWLTGFLDPNTISPVGPNGCSLSRAWGFPIKFVFVNEPYLGNVSCGGLVYSMSWAGLAGDLAIWFVIGFLLLFGISIVRGMRVCPAKPCVEAVFRRNDAPFTPLLSSWSGAVPLLIPFRTSFTYSAIRHYRLLPSPRSRSRRWRPSS